MDFEFLPPKKDWSKKVDWLISEHSQHIVQYYAEFTGYSKSDIVDYTLKNLPLNPEFQEWVKTKRNNKRIMSRLSQTALWRNKKWPTLSAW